MKVEFVKVATFVVVKLDCKTETGYQCFARPLEIVPDPDLHGGERDLD